ncbi:MAG TPA: hypothetical protein VM408_01975 [Methylomirabilota bacterium]|nr:hypothetical protein [Methylomirabilota bacterium]
MPDDLRSDIQSTAEDIAADSETLRGIETEKATLDAADPRLLELSRQAKTLGREIASKTVAEHELVLEASGGGPDIGAAESPA